MKTNIIKNIFKFLIPIMQVFGIYVIIFGHISPGGGFAGGSIIGASLIISSFVDENHKARYDYKYLLKLTSLSLITYGIIKGTVFILSFFGLHITEFFRGTPGSILSGGFILPLNILVGVVVAVTMYFIALLLEEGELESADATE